MNLARKHWYDFGGIFAVLVLTYVIIHYKNLDDYQLLMWLSLVTLFLHQLEEYRFAGTFPGMINKIMFHSDNPDRYPLNTNTALIINVIVGWLFYFLAAFLGEKTMWLGLATILVSFGNFIAHTFVFNIKGKTFYNAGMITAWIFFLPCTCFFFFLVNKNHLMRTSDYLIGISLGIVLNVVGIFKMIEWLKDKNTKYIFPERNLLPAERKNSIDLKPGTRK